MKSPALFLAALFSFSALLVDRVSLRAAPEDADAAQLYREAFALAETLPGNPEEFTRTATRETVGTLEQALGLIRKGAGADSVDWGIDWELEGYDGIEFDLPGRVRQLTRLGTTYHKEKLKRGESSRFAADMVALIELSRDFSRDQVLIHFLTKLATEGVVTAMIAEHAGALPPEVRDELLGRLASAPAGPTLAEVFETESAATRGQLWNVFAGTADLGEGVPPALVKESTLHDRLRVSSVVIIGKEPPMVGFEDLETGQAFRLSPGEKYGDIELISMDTEAGRAIVRQGSQSAVIALAGRKLLPVDLEAAWGRLMLWLDESGAGAERNAGIDGGRLLEEAGGDYLSAFEAVLLQYDQEAGQLVSMLTLRHDQLPTPEEAGEGLSALTRSTARTLVSVRQSELRQLAEKELLMAGLQYLASPKSPLPTSKVTGDPIQIQREEKQLVLESTFPETRKDRQGRPLRLPFPLGEGTGSAPPKTD